MKHAIVNKIVLAMVTASCCIAFAKAQPTSEMSSCPRYTSEASNRVRVVYYDARKQKFFYENGKSVMDPLPIGEHVVLEVCHARFGEQFDFILTEKALPEAGAPVRGIDDVQGLIKGLPGSPAAKGAATLEAIKVSTFPDVVTALARLHSLQDIIDLHTALRLDLESITYGKSILDEEYLKYRRAICQMTVDVNAADCATLNMPLSEDTGLPPRVDHIAGRLQKLNQELQTASSLVPVQPGVDVSCPSQVDPHGRSQYIDKDQFVCFVKYTNFIIGQFKNVRAMIQQPPLGSTAPDLISALEVYRLRVITYAKTLQQVRNAVIIEKIILDSDADPDTLLTRLKKIQDTYKEVITPDDLQRLADQQGHFIQAKERDEMKKELNSLLADIDEALMTPAKLGGDVIQRGTTLEFPKGVIVQKIDAVRNIDLFFGAHVYQVNKALVEHIKELYRLYQQSEVDPLFVQMFTWTGNTGAILTVKVNDSFKPADLNNLDLPMETAGVETASVNSSAAISSTPATPAVMVAQTGSATITPAPIGATVPQQIGETPPSSTGNASTVTTSEFLAAGNSSTAFEVHKTYRFNVAAGVLFSSVRQDNFALRVVSGTGGNTNLVLAQTGKDPVRVDFPVFLMTYLGKPLDVFATSAANKNKFGAAVGFSTLDVANNAYAGAVYQPRLGLDFLFGLHLARRNVPDRGIVTGVTVLDPNTTTVPIHQEWRPGLFGTIGFDALTFKKLFFGSN